MHSAELLAGCCSCHQVAPGVAMPYKSTKNIQKTLSLRTTAISLKDLTETSTVKRKTKIVCTLGPAW